VKALWQQGGNGSGKCAQWPMLSVSHQPPPPTHFLANCGRQRGYAVGAGAGWSTSTTPYLSSEPVSHSSSGGPDHFDSLFSAPAACPSSQTPLRFDLCCSPADVAVRFCRRPPQRVVDGRCWIRHSILTASLGITAHPATLRLPRLSLISWCRQLS
jgi:hypothetical protein